VAKLAPSLQVFGPPTWGIGSAECVVSS